MIFSRHRVLSAVSVMVIIQAFQAWDPSSILGRRILRQKSGAGGRRVEAAGGANWPQIFLAAVCSGGSAVLNLEPLAMCQLAVICRCQIRCLLFHDTHRHRRSPVPKGSPSGTRGSGSGAAAAGDEWDGGEEEESSSDEDGEFNVEAIVEDAAQHPRRYRTLAAGGSIGRRGLARRRRPWPRRA